MSLIQISLTDVKFDIEGFPGEGDYITSCMKEFANWEPNISDKFSTILRQAKKHNIKGIVLDVGACYGYYSLIAAQNNFTSHAFEPNPVTLEILKKNIQVSGKGQVIPHNIGLGNKYELKSIEFSRDNIGGASLKDLAQEGKQLEIQAMDNVPLEQHVIIYKIDAEGYEPEVIAGSIKTIKDLKVDFIILEISPKFYSIKKVITEVFNVLWAENYMAFDIGLQDSGKLEDALKKFELFTSEEELENHLLNTGQTNFLFVRKDNADLEYLTGSLWKDELLSKWSIESYSSNVNKLNTIKKDQNSIHLLVYEVKKENRKLYELLKNAAAFQNELLESIKKKDEYIALLENTNLQET